ncbi:VacJ family lipoprotein [Roseibacterium sp. SDUM158016]|uniref:MlaA family lipoprotein n=1 Tax=Roseicyclus sediminis TaxID=2980997 RepID=UPI0021CF58BE|nr:VacJ family lipoprotein [Roseibacterium sp. SDUM158016]MCU4652491.1 VacJ family lipoprotein [Roseibacterium sp. SDUM158016]
MPRKQTEPRPGAPSLLRRRVPAARGGLAALFGLALAALAACSPAPLPPGDRIADASEDQNRAVHRFNVALDRALVGPAANAYGDVIPRPVRRGVGNFASNLSQPSYVLNNLLQLRIDDAAKNTLRFAINSTVGIGGLFDPATALGLPAEVTDFGETLHIYGVGEGDYHVLPVLGPSTTRDSVGRVVDFAMNPLRHVVDPPQSTYLLGARALGAIGTRSELGGAIDDILYGSEDSYAALRSLYLQNRRFELGGGGADPYADPYVAGGETGVPEAGADPYLDPYADPYFDPYAP